MNRKIPIAKPYFGEEEQQAVREVLESGYLASGPRTRQFEKDYAEFVGAKQAVLVTNGTVALDVALKSLKISSGDEVITSAFSFIASGNCILFQNAKPVFADIDPKTFNIDASDVAEKVTSKTKAIIPIYMFGQPANMDAIKEVAQDKKISVVEDAAQAHGAEYKNQKAGSIGDLGCFSFYATKNMTAGEGGMVTTSDQNLADRARLLINHGQNQKYHHKILGYNYRSTEMCAAIGLVQLKKLNRFNEKRIANAERLNQEISKLDGLTVPYVDKDVKHVFHQYVIKVEDSYPLNRDELADCLSKKGVGVAVHYPIAIYKQELYKQLGYKDNQCPNTERACKQVLSLPVHPLVSKDDITYIIDALKEVSK